MRQRTNAHDLPSHLRRVLAAVVNAPTPVTQLELARQFGGGVIEQLRSGGHLADGLVGGRDCLVVAPLTRKELDGYRPWKRTEDRTLCKEWTGGTPIIGIAEQLRRTGGDVISRAGEMGLIRPNNRRDGFVIHVPAWRVQRLRIMVAEAERRGLDPSDDGQGLTKASLLRRLIRARVWLASASKDAWQQWSAADLRALRRLRSEGRSIQRIAQMLNRPAPHVAQRINIEGRSMGGAWTEEEDKVIVEGIRDGFDYGKISSRLPGRSKVDAKSRIRQLSVSKLAKRPWTEGEVRALLMGARDGLRGSKLSARVPSRGHHAVRRKFYKLTRETRAGSPWTEFDFHLLLRAMKRGEEATRIAVWLDRDLPSVEERINDLMTRKPGRTSKIGADNLAKAKRMFVDGAPVKKIAEAIGVSRPAVYRALHRVGAYVPRAQRQ